MVKDPNLMTKLAKFALQTADVLNLNFASVDIIKDKNDGYKILEINSGIMMETYSKLSEEHYNIAKHIYRSAICDYFNVPIKDNMETIYEKVSAKILERSEGAENGRRTNKIK